MNEESRQAIHKAEVAAPCEQPWEEMSGDEKARLCSKCSLNVYNFAEMTESEIAEIIQNSQASNSRVCVKIYKRFDGKILTKDCPVGVRLLEAARYELYTRFGFIASSIGCLVAVVFSFATGTLTASISKSFATIVNQLGRLNSVTNSYKSRPAESWVRFPTPVQKERQGKKLNLTLLDGQ